MKINPSEPVRPVANQPAATAAPPSEKPSVMANDRLLVARAASPTPEKPAGFSWKEAMRYGVGGFIKQPLAVWKGIKEHPLRAAAIGAAAGAGILFLPAVLPISLATLGTILAVGFGSWGALNIGMGAFAARNHYRDGKFDEAAQDFERIGEGAFNLASAAAPYVGRQVMKLLRAEVTTEAAMASRLAEGADIVATKAEGLERAAMTVTEAGSASEAESLVTAAQQLKGYEEALRAQAEALKKGKQTVDGARKAVQAATREVQSASPAVEPSAIRLANRASQRTWVQKVREHASRHYYRVRTDKGIASRAQAAQKALGVRRFFKILQPFIGVVPAAPVPDEPPKP